MRILVISNSEWDDSNSFGNTMSNFFGGIEDIHLSNIYCRHGMPSTDACSHFYCISEISLLKSIFIRSYSPGKQVQNVVIHRDLRTSGKTKVLISVIKYFKKGRLVISGWLRDIIWLIADYRTIEFYRFIEEAKPDLLFVPIYQLDYINKMALHLSSKYKVPIVTYMSDDEYTLKQFSLSPLYWLNRLHKRNLVKKVIEKSKVLFVVGENQIAEYKKYFKTEIRVLLKYGETHLSKKSRGEDDKVRRFVYTGNIGDGRLESLIYLAKIITKEKIDGISIDVYTPTPISFLNWLKLKKYSFIQMHDSVNYRFLKAIYTKSDVLLHLEPMDLFNRYKSRMSFSTKIIDYMASNRLILAVGWKKSTSISYLETHRCGLVLSGEPEDHSRISLLFDKNFESDTIDNAAITLASRHSKKYIHSQLMLCLKELLTNIKNDESQM